MLLLAQSQSFSTPSYFFSLSLSLSLFFQFFGFLNLFERVVSRRGSDSFGDKE